MTTEEQLAMTTALEQKKAQPRLPLSRMNGKLQADETAMNDHRQTSPRVSVRYVSHLRRGVRKGRRKSGDSKTSEFFSLRNTD